MKNEDPRIEVARINARQAILGAVIVGLVSIITTLIATGNLFTKDPLGTSSTATGRESPGTILDAPHLAFSTKKIEFSLDQCMNNAKEALDNAKDTERKKYTGLESRRYIAWAYNGDTTGLIWCHTDEGIVIFIGAGKNWTRADETRVTLLRSFRTSK